MWGLTRLTSVLFKGQQYLHLLWLLRYLDLFLSSCFVYYFFYFFFSVSCLLWNKSRFHIPFSTSLRIIFFILLNKIRTLELAQVKYCTPAPPPATSHLVHLSFQARNYYFWFFTCYYCYYSYLPILPIFYSVLLLLIYSFFLGSVSFFLKGNFH